MSLGARKPKTINRIAKTINRIAKPKVNPPRNK
jgi:hypothetical protein